MLRMFMGTNSSECYLEGQRLKIAGNIYSLDVEEEAGNVELLVRYWLNSESVIDFGGIILQGMSREDRLRLRGKDVAIATCTVGSSVFTGLMGTSRILTDCTLYKPENDLLTP